MNTRKLGCALVTALLLCLAAAAETGPESISWKTPGNAASATGATDAAITLGAGGTRHVVVQFSHPITSETRKPLNAAGVRLLHYLGADAYFAQVTGGAAAVAAAAKAGVSAAFEIAVDWKLHPMIANNALPEYAVFPVDANLMKAGADKNAPQEKVAAVYVLFHPDVDLRTEGLAALQRHGGLLRELVSTINAAVAWVPLDALTSLAAEDAVQWIEPPIPPLSVTNDSNRAITGANIVNAAPYNLDGSGITVLVYDGGTARATHVDFGGRLTVHDYSGMDDHPTHVSATIGGSGLASSGLYRGMAPGVLLESYGLQDDGTGQWLYTNPGDIESDYGEAINSFGAMVSNNSIGTNVAWNGYSCDWEGDYGATDILLDQIVRGALGSPFRIVWAAGNERGGSCGSTYHLTAPPANAKNHITVGALNSNDDSMTSFSSWGPSDDGRIKPDICAPGCQSNSDGGVTSCFATSNTAYGVMCGTSMATPTVTGLSALLLQAWQEKFPGEDLPRNSTLKVLYAHNAVDLGNTGPDYKFGYGSVRIQQSIDFLKNNSFIEAPISQGATRLYYVYVPSGTAQLKATLAWDDYPGTVNTVPELINDLDITAIAPGSGTTYYPWTLDPSNPSVAAVRTAADHRNNIEQVAVDAPPSGTWTIVVSGTVIPEGPQVFSLATTPDFNTATQAGALYLNSNSYSCTASPEITVSDTGLNTDSTTIQTVTVSVASTSEAGGETVLLTETGPATATFTGAFTLSAENSAGVLLVAPGDTITATYIDADDGAGGVNVARTGTAQVDCTAPTASGVLPANISGREASITFTTDEAAHATVHYGTSCGVLSHTAEGSGFTTSHNIELSGLTSLYTYFYVLELTDAAGNTVTDNNDGACYSFTTAEEADYFTELFSGGFDLQNKTLYFRPNGSSNYYELCSEEATAFPTGITGGTSFSMSDDSYATCTLAGGAQVALYGTSYDHFYVSSNGHITFLSGSTNYSPSYSTHFSQPRITAMMYDLLPDSSGSISWKQLSDRAVVTWNNVRLYSSSSYRVNMQIQMFFDGMITVTFLSMPNTSGLTGISQGIGTPSDFTASDLSTYPACVWDPLKVSPGTGFEVSECVGIAPENHCITYTLENAGDTELNWQAVWNQDWVAVTPSTGQIAAGGAVTVTVCTTETVADLPMNLYADTVSFNNLATQYTQHRTVSLTVNELPPTPEVVAPGDGTQDMVLYPDLVWRGGDSIQCPTTYSVYLGSDPALMQPVCASTTALTCYPGILEPETTYFWQVTAENCCGTVPGPVWTFSTGACTTLTPAAPSPTDESTGISIAPTLSWDRAAATPKSLSNSSTGLHFVAIFQDTNPWGSSIVQSLLTQYGVSVRIYSSASMGAVNLIAADKVIVSSVQSADFYSALEQNRTWFEDYVADGGLLELHLASYSSSPVDGHALPGGFVTTHASSNAVSMADPTHQILNTPNVITNPMLCNWGSSTQGYFSSIPGGAVTIVSDDVSGAPCCMELGLGTGSILATTQTLEWGKRLTGIS